MRVARILTTALVLSVAAWSQAEASPITDPASLDLSGPSGTPLFDGSGVPFLLTTAPTYLQLPGNGNSDDSNGGGGGDNGAGGDSGGGGDNSDSFVNPITLSFFSGPFGSGPNDVGDLSDGADTGENTDGDAVNGGSSGVAAFDETPTGQDGDGPPQERRVAPEPSLVVLVGAGLTALVRRRSRTATTV